MQAWAHQEGGETLPGTATIRPVVRVTRPRRPATRRAARAQPGQVRMLRYKVCIVSWAAPGSRYKKNCIVAEGGDFGSRYSAPGLRYGAAMRHDTALGAATRAATHATRRAVHGRQGLGSRYKFCIMTGRGLQHGLVSGHDAATQRARACMRAATRPRHGRAQAAIRPGEGHDTAPGAPRHDWPSAQRARSLGHGCVHTVHLTQF